MSLNIIAWNAQSLKPKIPGLTRLIEKYKYQIILISETWLNDKIEIKIPNYNCYRKDRKSNSRYPHGGVAIFVHKSINHAIVECCKLNHIEAIFIKIPCFSNYITIASVYCPPSLSMIEFKNDINKLMSIQGAIVLAGDFNAKHQAWNNISNCRKGIQLLKMADNRLFKIQAPNCQTLFPTKGAPSTVDFILCKNVNTIPIPKVVNELSSDHIPINFHIPNNIAFITKSKIFNFSKANWKEFRISIENHIMTNNFLNSTLISINNINDNLNCFTDMIQKASTIAIPKKLQQTFKYPFSAEISHLTRERNRQRNCFSRSHDPRDKKILNALNRQIKLKTSKLNTDKWNEKLSNLNVYDCSLFQLTNTLNKKRKIIPPLKTISNNLSFSDEDKANALSQTFLNCHNISINSPSPYQTEVDINISILDNKPITIEMEDLWDEVDVQKIIEKLKVKKATGYDNISNRVLKNLPFSATTVLTNLFNACLKLCYFPNSWKKGKIIAIPKPDKDHSDPLNYRPITLLPTMGKVFEKLVLIKLINFEENNNIIIPEQFGFRSAHSTTQQVLRITENIALNFNNNLSTGMTLLDIEKAFDCVWHDALLFKLCKTKYPVYLIKLIKSFLTNREAFVSVGDENSSPYLIPAGVPQGSLLSPHLFNVFINDTSKPKNCKLAIYADDTALYTKVPMQNMHKLIENLEAGLIEINEYFNSWKIKINHSKTEAIVFTHSTIMKKEQLKHQISFNNSTLIWNKKVKYLGILLDNKVLFKENVLSSIKKTNKRIALIYCLLKKNSPLNIHSKLTLYRSYLRPILTYACPVFANCAKSHLDKLQRTQNKCLRMILSAPYITKIAVLHEEANIPYIHEFIDKLTENFYKKAHCSKNKLIKKLGKYQYNSLPFRLKHRLPKKRIYN